MEKVSQILSSGKILHNPQVALSRIFQGYFSLYLFNYSLSIKLFHKNLSLSCYLSMVKKDLWTTGVKILKLRMLIWFSLILPTCSASIPGHNQRWAKRFVFFCESQSIRLKICKSSTTPAINYLIKALHILAKAEWQGSYSVLNKFVFQEMAVLRNIRQKR